MSSKRPSKVIQRPQECLKNVRNFSNITLFVIFHMRRDFITSFVISGKNEDLRVVNMSFFICFFTALPYQTRSINGFFSCIVYAPTSRDHGLT